MDLIEIIVRTEDAFGITIPDEAAVQITTPRELADFVATQVTLGDDSGCLTHQSFHFLREQFRLVLSFPRKSFRPNAYLEDILRKQDRRKLWLNLQTKIGKNALPDLGRPVWLFWTLAALAILVLVGTTYLIENRFRSGFINASICGLAATTGFMFLSERLTRSAKQCFRRGYRRVSDIANYLVANKPYVLKRNGRIWTNEQILKVVREIVAEYTSSPNFSDDAHFISDLHLD